MSRYPLRAVPLFLLLGLVACSPDSPAPATSASTATSAASDGAAAVEPVRGFAYSPLPADVVVTQPFHVRGDRIYQTKNGSVRRRSTLELLEGDPATVAQAIGQDLVAKGYKAVPSKDKGDNIIRLGFVRKDAGRLNVSASPDRGEKPANPAAVGVLAVDWLVERPATPADAPAGTTQGD